MIESQLLAAIKDGGAFVLAAVLVIYVMKANDKREERFEKREERFFSLMQLYGTELTKLTAAIEDILRHIPPGMGRKRDGDADGSEEWRKRV